MSGQDSSMEFYMNDFQEIQNLLGVKRLPDVKTTDLRTRKSNSAGVVKAWGCTPLPHGKYGTIG